MNDTRYTEGITITTLDIINASAWMQHGYRSQVRVMVTWLTKERADLSTYKVEIGPTYTTVTLISHSGKADVVIAFRHWLNQYAGCTVDETMAYAWYDNQWVNLN